MYFGRLLVLLREIKYLLDRIKGEWDTYFALWDWKKTLRVFSSTVSDVGYLEKLFSRNRVQSIHDPAGLESTPPFDYRGINLSKLPF